ncbi:MAG TPA: DUF5996 family protein [Stellaceae bacterium]|jgi:hypothetical protein|nr:DUF5996 family protein [Stellaceae bacterium]
MDDSVLWPALDYPHWRDTAITLQLWTQIVGKIRLALTPWLNHSWQVPLYVSARGLTTGPISTADKEILELEFDFASDRLLLRTSRGATDAVELRGQDVASFYRCTFDALRRVGVAVTINGLPNEMPDPQRFLDDHVHATYDPGAALRFWRALIQADRVFKLFRSGFLGKASPVHFFWGSFDLAVTRFSGRTAPPHPGGVPHLPDAVAREAYSHEVSSAGFWPGSDVFPRAAFYSYAYPEPPGYRTRAMPQGAAFEPGLGEFILPYDTLRAASDPDALLLDFLNATYAAAADCGNWDRAALECALGAPGKVRPV